MFTRTFQSYPELLSIWARTTFDIYWVSTKIFILRIILNSESRDNIVVTDGTTQTQQAVLLSICQMNCSEHHTQAEQEHASAPALWLAYWVLLLSRIGQQLQENASRNNRTLAQELEQSLGIFQEQLPVEQINQLASLASDADSDGDLPSLIRVACQERNRLNPEADTELNKTRKEM